MNLQEYLYSHGIKICFWGKKHGISQSAIFRIFRGELVGKRIAEQVRAATNGKVIPPHTLKRRISVTKKRKPKEVALKSK